MEEADDEDFQVSPPTQQRVAQRAIVLTILAYRGRLDSQSRNPAAVASWVKVKDWFGSLNINEELEPEEEHVFAAPLGTLTFQQAINAGWRTEGAGVLAWALNCYSLPKLDEFSNIDEIADGLGILNSLEKSTLYTGRLRSPEEIEHYGSIALTIHWRLRQFGLQPEAIDFEAFVRGAWWGPLSLDGVKLLKKDMAIQNKPISKADRQVVEQVQSIAMERHQAINWLMGWDEIYSDVDTST
ncbi:MAG TPA: DUF4272 domain-containing protein [Hymenobacter sp.]